jgi:hypothetical protein
MMPRISGNSRRCKENQGKITMLEVSVAALKIHDISKTS